MATRLNGRSGQPDNRDELGKRGLLWGLTGAFVLCALALLHFLSITAEGTGVMPWSGAGTSPSPVRLWQELLHGLLWPIRSLADRLPALHEPGMAYAYIAGLGFLYGIAFFAFRVLLSREAARKDRWAGPDM